MSDQPRYSDDGKFYWDGQRWVPLSPLAPTQQNVSLGMRPGTAFSTGLFGALGARMSGCAGCLVIIVILVILAAIGSHH